MRIHRIVAGLIALLMLALLPVAAGSSALAADGGASADKLATASVDGAPKPSRKITIHGKEPRTNKFFITGKIGPVDYDGKPIFVQRKLASQKKWRSYKKIRSTQNSSYRTRIEALNKSGKVEYRTVTQATDNFRKSISNGKIVITTY